ncbi:hypothetical protein [Mesorhizobium sp. M0488]|uniref:hypothetical protein n=1 Tax=unclassified Mesorhizobium TaxID=325217 RepID=UPI00333599AB
MCTIVEVLLEMAWRRFNGLLSIARICWSTGVSDHVRQVLRWRWQSADLLTEAKQSLRVPGKSMAAELEADKAAGKKLNKTSLGILVW